MRNFLMGLLTATATAAWAQPSTPLQEMKPHHGFIENKGQVVDQDGKPNDAALYIFQLPGNTIVLKATGFSYDTYAMRETTPQAKRDTESIRRKPIAGEGLDLADHMEVSRHRVDIEFVDANPHPEIVSSQQAVDYIMYYTNDVSLQAWHYGKVTYRNIYPNIDVEFLARPGQEKPVEYNFIVHPGGDMKQIQLRYEGAHASKLAGGKLNLELEHGKLTEYIPASYWQNSKEHVNIHYRQVSKLKSGITIGFDGQIKKSSSQNLIIDPAIQLDWEYRAHAIGAPGTIGSAGLVRDLTVDNAGNTYITGYINSTGLATTGVFQRIYGGGFMDGFVAKLSSTGVLQWFTYYGGSDSEQGLGVAVDPKGNVFVTGWTFSANGIASSGAYQIIRSGTNDAFLVKFTNSGSRVWGTYYGGTGSEGASDIAIAPDGSCFITGSTSSTTSIATPGTHQSVNRGNYDAFVTKFNSSGKVQWGTYFGGGAQDAAADIAYIESEGSICLVGETASTDFISTPDAYQKLYGGIGPMLIGDGFVSKMNATSGTLIWATYYGDGFDDTLYGVTTDNLGNIYAAGSSGNGNSANPSTGTLATSGTHQTTIAGREDAVVVKFNSIGVRQWGTYYGGTSNDGCAALAVDDEYAVYLAGGTNSINGIVSSDPYRSTPSEGWIARLNPNGSRDWGTYYNTPLSSMEITPDRRIVVGGDADRTASPALVGSFSTKVSCTPPELATLAIQKTNYLCAVEFTAQQFRNCRATYSWNFGDGGTSVERTSVHSYSAAGTYTVTLQVSYNCGSCPQGDITLTQQVTVAPNAINFENITLQVSTDQRNDILEATASTFSDAWPLDQLDPALAVRGSFINGSQGVWRNNATYVYEKPRKRSDPVTLATDGTFVLDRFDWEQAHFNIIPNWIQANTMTRYSPFSYELENKDVLGVYSGAVYDYGGQLLTATGLNMRNGEMGFTSFEFLDKNVAGNWVLGTQPLPLYSTYIVNAGKAYVAVVEATMDALSNNIETIDVMGLGVVPTLPGLPSAPIVPFYAGNEHIVCMRVHPDNPDWTMVVLDKAPFNGTWIGQLRVRHTVTPTVVAVIDSSTPAHSGKKSLKITTDQTFKQEVLSLAPGKSYLLNCWASVQNPNVTTPVLTGGPGIEITARQKNNQVIQTFQFTPGGPLIDGWQQIKGTFVCPVNAAYIEIKFKKGTAVTAWFDDLRLQPENGNMKGYVYNLTDFHLQAILDEENFASYFFYDQEGNLSLTKKETIDGVKTLSENASYTKPTN
jgi:PKD repeat protein